MELLVIYGLVFILGLLVGSFLNVVIYRYNTGMSVVSGRSRCLTCAHTLRWFELIPVVSFVIQAGRCRECHSRLSWQYPAVELLTGLIFLRVFQVVGGNAHNLELAFWWLVFSILIVITIYDLRHKIIPDGLVGLLAGLAVLQWLIFPALAISNYLLAGFSLFGFFALLWWVSQGRWMGFGDAKLALALGLLLGLQGGVSTVVLAFWLGALVGLFILTLSRLSLGERSFTIKSEIPFAPFLAVGLALYFLFNVNVLTFF